MNPCKDVKDFAQIMNTMIFLPTNVSLVQKEPATTKALKNVKEYVEQMKSMTTKSISARFALKGQS